MAPGRKGGASIARRREVSERGSVSRCREDLEAYRALDDVHVLNGYSARICCALLPAKRESESLTVRDARRHRLLWTSDRVVVRCVP